MQNIEQLLQEQLVQVTSMERVLEREHEALRLNDAEQLEAVADEKMRLIESLTKLGERLNTLLVAVGYSDDKGGLAAFLQSDTTGRFTRQWGEVEASLKRCETLNQRNGILLEAGRTSAQQLLSLLLGHGGTATTPLYDARGNASTGLPSSQGRSIKV